VKTETLQGAQLSLFGRIRRAMGIDREVGAIVEEEMFFEDVDVLVAACQAVVDGGGAEALQRLRDALAPFEPTY
jgi:hypothetical protein